MIEWRDSYAIGHTVIDSQHKEIFNRINKLMEACNQGKGKEEVANTVSYLNDYVVKHFTDEENLMKKHNYTQYAAHKPLHDGFVKTIGDLKADIEKNGVSVVTVINVLNNVTKWLTLHITNVDTKFAAFMKEKGLN